MMLRAGMPVAVIAEIGARVRIVGTIALHAIADGIVASGRRSHRHRTIVIRSVIIVSGRVGRAAIIAGLATIIAARGNGAADHGTCDRAGNEAAATATAVVTPPAAAPVITAATTAATAEARAATAAAVKARTATATGLRNAA